MIRIYQISVRRVLAAVFAVAVPREYVHAHDAKMPDDHAPLGVMGDHVHNAGEFMVSYRFSRMSMEGNRDGTSE